MKNIKKGGLSRRFSLGVAGAKSGFGLLQAKAGSMLLPKDQQQAYNDQALEREAHRFVSHLGELKGAYVKIGQMLALYGEHIMPAQVTKALHTLEASTKPLDWGVIQPVLNSGLNDTVRPMLQVEHTPIAAASLSQVHQATLCGPEGCSKSVCVKIQYPGITEAIEDDFKNVMQMLRAARWIKSGRQMERLTKELKRYLLREVDYGHELETAEKVRKLLNGDLRYKVPEYHADACTEKVLTMEFVSAFDVTHERVQNLSQERRNALAENMLELFFKEAFEWNLMQTDPNFGNYRILIDEEGRGEDKLVLLDFGAVHELSESFSKSLKLTILAAQKNEIELIIEGLLQLNCLDESDSEDVKQSFANFCAYILEPFQESLSGAPQYAVDDGLYDWRHSMLLKRAGKLASQGALVRGFKWPPPEFMLMIRKLTGVFTFVSAIGAKTHSAHILRQS